MPPSPEAVFDHEFDIFEFRLFITHLLYSIGEKKVSDILHACGQLPTLEMVIADEVTVYRMFKGLPYDDNPDDGPLPGMLGDDVSHAKDLIEIRIFMKRLIIVCGVTQAESLIDDVTVSEFLKNIFRLELNSYYKEQHMFNKLPLNENGKRVLEIAETRYDVVLNEETWTPNWFTKRTEKVPKITVFIDFIDLTLDD